MPFLYTRKRGRHPTSPLVFKRFRKCGIDVRMLLSGCLFRNQNDPAILGANVDFLAVELEGFENETALFEAAVSDSVCPAVCVNPDNTVLGVAPRGGRGRSARSACVLRRVRVEGVMSAERIRELNDAFRTTMTGGQVLLTAGVNALPSDVKALVIRRVAMFSDFNEDNDPHEEHDSCLPKSTEHTWPSALRGGDFYS